MKKNLDKPNEALFKAEVERALQANPKLHHIFKYLRDRKRVMKTSDIYQLYLQIRKSTKDQVSTTDIEKLLSIFEKSGVGYIDKEDPRPKFIWKFAVLPVMDENNECRAVDFKSSSLLAQPRLFPRYMDEIDEKELVLKKEGADKLKIDVLLFDGKRPGGPLGGFSLDELLDEVRKRGYQVTLKDAKTR
jgi:hypothetical protein